MLSVYQCPIVSLIVGLPIQVRDAAMSIKDEMPKSEVNKEYYSQNIERQVRIKPLKYMTVRCLSTCISSPERDFQSNRNFFGGMCCDFFEDDKICRTGKVCLYSY